MISHCHAAWRDHTSNSTMDVNERVHQREPWPSDHRDGPCSHSSRYETSQLPTYICRLPSFNCISDVARITPTRSSALDLEIYSFVLCTCNWHTFAPAVSSTTLVSFWLLTLLAFHAHLFQNTHTMPHEASPVPQLYTKKLARRTSRMLAPTHPLPYRRLGIPPPPMKHLTSPGSRLRFSKPWNSLRINYPNYAAVDG